MLGTQWLQKALPSVKLETGKLSWALGCEGQETRKGKPVRKITATQMLELALGNPFLHSSRKQRQQQTRRGPGLQAATFPLGMWYEEGQWWGQLPISRTKPVPFTCRSKLAVNKICGW